MNIAVWSYCFFSFCLLFPLLTLNKQNSDGVTSLNKAKLNAKELILMIEMVELITM